MLLTQLFYIGSNIFPPHTHAPLANPAQSNPCSGNHLFFFFFLGIQRPPDSSTLLALCSFVREKQERIFYSCPISSYVWSAAQTPNWWLQLCQRAVSWKEQSIKIREGSRYPHFFCPFGPSSAPTSQPLSFLYPSPQGTLSPAAEELTSGFSGDTSADTLPPPRWHGCLEELLPKVRNLCREWRSSADSELWLRAVCRLKQHYHVFNISLRTIGLRDIFPSFNRSWNLVVASWNQDWEQYMFSPKLRGQLISSVGFVSLMNKENNATPSNDPFVLQKAIYQHNRPTHTPLTALIPSWKCMMLEIYFIRGLMESSNVKLFQLCMF